MSDQKDGFESRAFEAAVDYTERPEWDVEGQDTYLAHRDSFIAGAQWARKEFEAEIERLKSELPRITDSVPWANMQNRIAMQSEIERFKSELEQANQHWYQSNKERAEFELLAENYRAKLQSCHDHCLCTRNTYGFDYGEKHAKLGNPKSGARWLTPVDIARQALAELEGEK